MASTNRVRELYSQGKVALGTYVTFPTTAVVEVAALAGFVRIDAYHTHFGPETLLSMVHTAYSHNLTPWLRCRNDPWEIMMALDYGSQAITIPNVGTAEAARAAVAAAFYPPKGEREMSRPLRFRGMSAPDYLDWVERNVMVSCMIEGIEGLENYKEIVKVEGLDCIQTGKGDLSLALGVPGELFHPKVIEAEERVVAAALDAGKQVSLNHPLTPEGVERMHYWIERGVRIFTVDSEHRLLAREWGAAVKDLRGTS